ncbi:MAG: hypothetical protein K2X27_14460 [Candidatus Obscuribacterales bacterium]|nr:hypothetical protein [Candidatus Obscuribacterales bacterium]
MPPFYKQSNGMKAAGAGISEAGYEGASTLFEQAKGALGDAKCPFMPSNAEEAASAKAAADAYLSCRNGQVGADAAFNQQGAVDVPDLQISSDASVSGFDLGKMLNDFVGNMGDMLNQVVSGPLGIIGSLVSFLVKLFSDMAGSLADFLAETARAAAASVEEALKKQMQASADSAKALQSLELYNQSASTQILSHSLSSSV